MNLHFTQTAWDKLNLYIKLAEGEVGGLASVVPTDDGWQMTECFLIDQRATDDARVVGQVLVGY